MAFIRFNPIERMQIPKISHVGTKHAQNNKNQSVSMVEIIFTGQQ